MNLLACRHLFSIKGKRWLKTLLIMKLTAILLIAVSVSATAGSFGQKINLSEKNASLGNIFKAIKKQTGYTFVYTESLLKKAGKVDLNVNEASLEEVLNTCLRNKPLMYSILNKIVIIKDKEEPAENNIVNAPPPPPPVVKISGKITNEKGEALAGASIREKGGRHSAVSKEDGSFTISISGKKAVLIVSYIGYVTSEIAVTENVPVTVSLVQTNNNLNEFIAIGYGTQKKVNLTGSVGTVNMSDMEDRPLTNAGLALQGTVSGVYALQSSGKPGDDGAVIDIRGVGTFGDNSPLVLIDGLPGSIGDVNANDIQSISVLKDAASSSIYGNRAANGVILITTKKGAVGKLKVNYSAYFGVQSPTRLPDVLNSVEYATLRNEASANSGTIPNYTAADIAKYAAHNNPMYPDINYFKVYYGNANMQSHRLSISGGSEHVQYAFMLGHLDQDGILVATNYKKTDFRSNVDAFFLKDKRLRVSAKLAGNLGVKSEPTSMWNATWYATLSPVYPLRDSAGRYMSVNGELNPYAEIMAGSTAITKRYNFNGQVEAEYKLLKNLSAQITGGYNVTLSNYNGFNANVVLQNKDGSTKTEASDLSVSNGTNIQTLLTGLLKYYKTFGQHDFNILAGYSEEEFTYDWQSGYRKNFVNNSQRVLSLGDASTQTNNAGSYDLGLRSLFGRLNYTWGGKYLFEANIRRDGSSRFAKGHQWGTFPSFSGGWIVSRENFMKKVDWINFLKLRASWGQLGNQNISTYYNGSDILSSGRNYSYGGTLYSGVAVTSLTNKELTWETAQQLNIGVDVTLKHGFDLTVDFFDKRTKNLLLSRPIPLTMALSAPYVNAGEVQNKGIEASLNYRKTFSNGLKLRAGLNVSHIVNKITRMNAPEQLNSPKAIKVGAAINSFYGYTMDGIYQIADFTWQNNSDPSIPYVSRVYTLKPGVTKVSNYNAQPGDIKFKDLNGDGVVDMNNDRAIIGKQFPDINYAFNFNLQWKSFDLGVFFQGVSGIQGYFYYEIATPFSGVANLGSWWKDRWTPANPSNTMPRVTLDETRTNIHSTFYMQDAAYLRLKNIELGYTISPKMLSKIGISSFRIYGNIQNAFTISKFKGFDPEQTIDQTRAEAFPQARIMTIGLNANF